MKIYCQSTEENWVRVKAQLADDEDGEKEERGWGGEDEGKDIEGGKEEEVK